MNATKNEIRAARRIAVVLWISSLFSMGLLIWADEVWRILTGYLEAVVLGVEG